MPSILKIFCIKSNNKHDSPHCKDISNCHFRNFGNGGPSPSKIIVSICRKPLCLPACKNSISSPPPPLFLKILQRNSKLVILHNLGMKSETFYVYLQAVTPSSFTFSLRYCRDIENVLFSVLWAFLAMHTQSGTNNFYKTLESCNLIDHQHFDP